LWRSVSKNMTTNSIIYWYILCCCFTQYCSTLSINLLVMTAKAHNFMLFTIIHWNTDITALQTLQGRYYDVPENFNNVPWNYGKQLWSNLHNLTPFNYNYYGSTALCRPLAAFWVSWSYNQSVCILGRESAYYKDSNYTQTTQTRNKRTQYRHSCLEWVSNPDHRVRASEDSSCLRLRSHCDRQPLSI
jgi:hypothetical protein